MSGVITFRHVALHAPTVIREFGWLVFFRCLQCALSRKHKTFLSLVYA